MGCERTSARICGCEKPSWSNFSPKSRKNSGQREKSTQIGGFFPTNLGCAPRNIRNYNLRREKADSDYNYKRCETVVGSHISTIIAVENMFWLRRVIFVSGAGLAPS